MTRGARRRLAIGAIGCAALGSLSARGDALERLDDALDFRTTDGAARATVSLFADVTTYVPDAPPPTLLFSDDDVFLAPRLSALLDANIGAHVAFRAQANVDRGFDPGEARHGDARLDEYALIVDARGDGKVVLELGKLATRFGAFRDEHFARDNPLITAPLIYEDVVPINDRAAPASIAAFTARRNSRDLHDAWVPIVWGPSYATGAALLARSDSLELAVEIKNRALSSRPATWADGTLDFDAPTLTGRIAWHPGFAWTLGGSASRGAYLQDEAQPTLPAGKHVDDYDQTTFGGDARFERHGLAIATEIVHAAFDVPGIGTVSVMSGYIEAKQKLGPQLWLAARWNQSASDGGPPGDDEWDRAVRRLDVGLGYRFDRRVAAKLQYSFVDQAGRDTNGDHLLAAQLTMQL